MSTITPELDEKAYGQLLRRTLPHVIRAHDECERLTSELLRLDEIEEAFHQQDPRQKTSPLFSRQRRTVHLASC